MTVSRRTVNAMLVGTPLAAALPSALAQSRKETVVLGMVLEPPSLDPTVAAGRRDRRDRPLQRARGSDQDRR